MAGAWPPMPERLGLAVTPGAVRRGERVRARWEPGGAAAGDELLLALVVHYKRRAATLEGPGDHGRFGIEQQVWQLHDRAPADDGGEALLRVPADGPYSNPGTVRAFFWGVALVAAGAPVDRPSGWSALRVLP